MRKRDRNALRKDSAKNRSCQGLERPLLASRLRRWYHFERQFTTIRLWAAHLIRIAQTRRENRHVSSKYRNGTRIQSRRTWRYTRGKACARPFIQPHLRGIAAAGLHREAQRPARHPQPHHAGARGLAEAGKLAASGLYLPPALQTHRGARHAPVTG